MRKPITDMLVIYEQLENPPKKTQLIVNEMFDVLFEETLKFLNSDEGKRMFGSKKLNSEGGEEKNGEIIVQEKNSSGFGKDFSNVGIS